jgi:HlyD family secretion protein
MDMQTLPNPAQIEAVLGLDRRSRGRRWLRRLVWALVAAGLAAAGGWYYLQRQAASQAVTYQTVKAAPADLTITVTATGQVQPRTEVKVSTETTGIVRQVNVVNNSVVKKGDVLAVLDTVSLQASVDRAGAALDQARANVLSAEATVTEAEQDAGRAATLQSKGFSATHEFDSATAVLARAKAALAAVQAQVKIAAADLALRRQDLAKARIISPIDGMVLNRNVEPGQTVISTSAVTNLFTIAEDISQMDVEANVDEADIGTVREGQRASFTVDAFPDRRFPAAIAKIEYAPTTTDNVVTYKAILSADNKDLLLRPGMTATAQIVVRELQQVLSVPNAAFRYQPPKTSNGGSFSLTSLFMPRMPRTEKTPPPPANGERGLWVMRDGAPQQITVKTGASDGLQTEIVSGDLKSGDDVVVSATQAGQ